MLHNNLVKILALLSFYHCKNGPARSCKFTACIVSRTQFQNVHRGCNVHKWIIMSPSSFLQYKVYRGRNFNKPYHNLIQYNTNYSTISQTEMSDTGMFGLFYMEDLNTHTHTHTHFIWTGNRFLTYKGTCYGGVSLYMQLSALKKDKFLRLLQIVKFANKITNSLEYCTQDNLTQCKK